jgi:hypothetical protein
MQETNIASLRPSFYRAAQVRRRRIAMRARAVSHTVSDRQALEEFRRVRKGIRGEARVQVLERLEIRAPSAEGEIAGTDKQMTVLAPREDGDLRMEHARGHGDRLDLVILADALRPLLA